MIEVRQLNAPLGLMAHMTGGLQGLYQGKQDRQKKRQFYDTLNEQKRSRDLSHQESVNALKAQMYQAQLQRYSAMENAINQREKNRQAFALGQGNLANSQQGTRNLGNYYQGLVQNMQRQNAINAQKQAAAAADARKKQINEGWDARINGWPNARLAPDPGPGPIQGGVNGIGPMDQVDFNDAINWWKNNGF